MATAAQARQETYGESGDISQDASPTRSLVIASTPRSGSSMLSGLLQQTGLMGAPMEYVARPNLEFLRERFGRDDDAELLRTVMRRRTTPNGVFSIKLHYEQYALMPSFHDLRAILPDPRIVFIERDDAIGQGISLARSRQTGSYGARVDPTGEAVYDFRLIDFAIRRVTLHGASWRYEIMRQDLPYIRVSFDDVREDPLRAVGRIAELMEIDLPPEKMPERIRTRPMPPNPDAEEWKARWRKEARVAAPFPGVERLHERRAPKPRPAPSLKARIKGRLIRMIDAI